MTSSYWFQGVGAPGPDVGDPIANSLRFSSADAPTLSRTMGSGNRKTYTISMWVKRAKMPSADQNHIWLWHDYPNMVSLQWRNNKLRFYNYNSGGTFDAEFVTTALFRDPSAWHHIVAAIDTTVVSPSTDRIKLWVNGERIEALDETNTFPLDFDSFVGVDGYTNLIGTYHDGSWPMSGYLADMYFIDGQALLASAFGRYNREGVWVPVKPDFSMTSGGEKYSTYLTVSGGTQYGDSSLAFNGDLDPTGSGSGRVYTDVGATLTWAPEPAVPFTTSLEVYNTNGAGQNEATWDGNTAAATGGWITVYTGSGEVSADKPLVVQGLSGRAEIHAIRIDGELVNDPFIWSSDIYTAASNDPNSTNKNFNTGANASPSASFDDNGNSWAQSVGSDTWLVFRPSTPITDVNSLAVTLSNSLTEVYVNGDDAGTVTAPGNYDTPVEITLPANFSGTLETLVFKVDMTQSVNYPSRIIVNGTTLIDGVNGSYGANGYHLDFSDPNDIGADRSGNGNHFTPNGFSTVRAANYSTAQAGSATLYTYPEENIGDNAPFEKVADNYIYFSPAGANTFTYTFQSPIPVTGSLDVIMMGGSTAAGYGSNNLTINYADGTSTTTSFLDSGSSSLVSVDIPVAGFGDAITSIVLDNPNNDGVAICGGFAGLKINGEKLLLSTTASDKDYDWMLDSPTQNYSTGNPLPGYQTNSTFGLKDLILSDGNLKGNTSNYSGFIPPTGYLTSGKWAFKFVPEDNGFNYVGVVSDQSDWQNCSRPDFPGYSVVLDSSNYSGKAQVYINNTSVSGTNTGLDYGTTETGTDIPVVVLLDVDNEQIRWDINGVEGAWVDYTQYLPANTPVAFYVSVKGDITFDFGQQQSFTPPEGFKVLQTQNLPSAPIDDGGEHFRVLTGSGASILSAARGQANADNGTGFQRALWWIKGRGTGNNQLLDSVRGGDRIVYSDGPNAESTYTAPTTDSVAWCWKAGDSVVTNNDGDIESQVSANPKAGFSIVNYTGVAGQDSVGHGLDKAPELILVTQLDDSTRWVTYHESLGSDSFLSLNTTESTNTVANYWGQGVTDTTFGVYAAGANNNTNGSDTLAYCWHSVPGYSKIGHYVGNGNNNGPLINCGFKPAFIMTKRVDDTSNWFILDAARNTYNPLFQWLEANEAAAEQNNQVPNYTVDFLANGFKIRGAGDVTNINNGEYVYMAFAQHPQGASKIAPATASHLGAVQYSGVLPRVGGSSLRFSNPNAHLERFNSVSGDQRTWTFSAWLKLPEVPDPSGDVTLFSAADSAHSSSPSITYIDYMPDGRFVFFNIRNNDSANSIKFRTQGQYRDPGAWYHLIVAVDTTQPNGEDRVKFFINGEEVAVTGDSTFGNQNESTYVNTEAEASIGRESVRNRYVFEGYMTEIVMIDGVQVVQPTEFGQYNSDGTWEPKNLDIPSFGINGFYLKTDPAYQGSNGGTTVLRDVSGNGKDWTMVDFDLGDYYSADFDWMYDFPTSNYATLNSIDPKATGIWNANLSISSGATFNEAPGTICMGTEGRYYAEANIDQSPTNPPNIQYGFIFAPKNGWNGTEPYTSTDTYILWILNGTTLQLSLNNAANVVGTLGYTPDPNSKMQCAYDAATRELYIGVNNNQWMTNDGTILNSFDASQPTIVLPETELGYSIGGTSYNGTVSLNYGQHPFAYTPPVGYSALQTQTLPEAPITNGRDHFKALTYTGTGTAQSLDFGFVPDFVWFKTTTAGNSHMLVDSVRGGDRALYSDASGPETTSAQYVTNFNNGGLVDIGTATDLNDTSQGQVAWAWKAGGAAVANTDGTIQSQVSVNTEAGFSIISYTGNNTTDESVGHGLSQAPELVIAKPRNQGNSIWPVYCKYTQATTPENQYLVLNTSAALTTDAEMWKAQPTSSVVNLGRYSNNNDAGEMIMYAWHSVPGFSSIGSYTGNADANGPFIYLGFRPAFVMVKCSTTAYDWIIVNSAMDVHNPATENLSPNQTSGAPYSGSTVIDLLSNGFKLRGTGTTNSNDNFIYCAFAENPFNISNAR